MRSSADSSRLSSASLALGISVVATGDSECIPDGRGTGGFDLVKPSLRA